MPLLPIKLPIQSPPLPLAMKNVVKHAIERISSQPPERPPGFAVYTINPPQ